MPVHPVAAPRSPAASRKSASQEWKVAGLRDPGSHRVLCRRCGRTWLRPIVRTSFRRFLPVPSRPLSASGSGETRGGVSMRSVEIFFKARSIMHRRRVACGLSRWGTLRRRVARRGPARVVRAYSFHRRRYWISRWRCIYIIFIPRYLLFIFLLSRRRMLRGRCCSRCALLG